MMDRKEFLRTCGLASLGIIGLTVPGCAGNKYVTGVINDNIVAVALSDFDKDDQGKQQRRSVIVKNENLRFPVIVFKTKNGYHAMHMQCTHQQAELNAAGDLLTCPAHGSEFNNQGEVIQGPAAQNLKKLKTTVGNGNIYIHLI